MKLKGAQLSKVVGCVQNFLNKELKAGRLVRDKNKLYDTDNEINKAWLVKRNVNPDSINMVGKKIKKKKLKAVKSNTGKVLEKKKLEVLLDTGAESEEGNFEDLTGLPDELLGQTIRQLSLKFGGFAGIKNYVDVLDKLMSARKKDIDAQEKRKELVSKDFVEYLKGYIDSLMNQLFDYAEAAQIDIIPLVQADPEKAVLKIPEILRKNFQKLAVQTQKQMSREIKNHNKERVKEEEEKK